MSWRLLCRGGSPVGKIGKGSRLAGNFLSNVTEAGGNLISINEGKWIVCLKKCVFRFNHERQTFTPCHSRYFERTACHM